VPEGSRIEKTGLVAKLTLLSKVFPMSASVVVYVKATVYFPDPTFAINGSVAESVLLTVVACAAVKAESAAVQAALVVEPKQ